MRTPPLPRAPRPRESTDVVEGHFLELVENECIVQAVTFRSDDPAFTGEMRMTWSLAPVPGGTQMTVTPENVPPGASPAKTTRPG